MLEPLKRELKQLLAEGRPEEIFRRLREELLDHHASCYNHAVLLESSWTEAHKQGILGTIDVKARNLSFTNISQALLWLIDSIEPKDLGAALRVEHAEHIFVPISHIYTCDRVDQSDAFQLYYYDPPPALKAKHEGKLHFCYFYGDSRQEHQALFKRLGLEIGGFLFNWQQGDYDPGIRIQWVEIKPRVSRNPQIFRINILKEIFGHFCTSMHQQQPIMKRKLRDLAEGAVLKSMGSEDLVFILLSLDDHNWDKNLVPDIMRSMYEDFCDCQLGKDSPQFFFFFSIAYQKTNKQVQEEVKTAISQASYGKTLPELEALSLEDISEWISRYPVIIPPGMEATEMTQALFPDQTSLDMADVILTLRKIVDQHNKGLIIKFD